MVFPPNPPPNLPLRTNLDLYWNNLTWGAGLRDPEHLQVRHLGLAAADLGFRGFSLITQANPSSPELPHYDRVQESDLRWHNQEGYVTRYGDVRELLQDIDDRYVITSPGDELRMRFAELPPPAAGWKRDFVLICDGWVKDGDYNSTFAGTILPLPYHAMTDYVLPPTTLEADHAYHTRGLADLSDPLRNAAYFTSAPGWRAGPASSPPRSFLHCSLRQLSISACWRIDRLRERAMVRMRALSRAMDSICASPLPHPASISSTGRRSSMHG
jgi:hypothetical protein